MDGPGKVAKVRKHQGSRTPYARPARRTAALEAVTPGAGVNVDDSEEPQPHSSLLASVLTAATTPLRAAASLITKVRLASRRFPFIHTSFCVIIINSIL